MVKKVRKEHLSAAELRALGTTPGLVVRRVPRPPARALEKGAMHEVDRTKVTRGG